MCMLAMFISPTFAWHLISIVFSHMCMPCMHAAPKYTKFMHVSFFFFCISLYSSFFYATNNSWNNMSHWYYSNVWPGSLSFHNLFMRSKSLGIIIIHFAWIAASCTSSNNLTRYISAASCRAAIASPWNLRSDLYSCTISCINLQIEIHGMHGMMAFDHTSLQLNSCMHIQWETNHMSCNTNKVCMLAWLYDFAWLHVDLSWYAFPHSGVNI